MDKNGSRTSRRGFLAKGAGVLGASALASAAQAQPSERASAPRRPNLVFFLGEGVRWDEISALGVNQVIHTPHLDRLVREGVTFKNSFVINALCLPSRATILTGMYSHVTGAIDNRNRPIPPEFPIFPELLRKAGYEIAFVGKSHIKGALRNYYWDYYFGFQGQADFYHPVIAEGHKGKVGEEKQYDGYVDDILAEHTLKYLKDYLSKPQEKPLCLFLWFYTPHAPFYRPRDLADLYNGVPIPKPQTFDADLYGYPGKSKAVLEANNKIVTSEVGSDDPRSLEELAKDHYVGVVNNDRAVGRIMALLEEKGVADDTAIIFSSDHGFFLGEWRFYDKRFMYEPSIRVPLTVRYPRLGTRERYVEAMTVNTDFAPTLLELAGVPVPQQMQGRSLVPFLKGERPAEWRKDYYYEYYEYPEFEHVRPHRGIRTERYKLIHYYFPDEEFELYDLENDPQEIKNLYGDPKHADLAKQLRQRLEELRHETGDTGKYDVTQAYVDEWKGYTLRIK
jgi:arylsulfatase A-like enzyme